MKSHCTLYEMKIQNAISYNDFPYCVFPSFPLIVLRHIERHIAHLKVKGHYDRMTSVTMKKGSTIFLQIPSAFDFTFLICPP